MQFKRFISILLSLITVNSFAGEEDLYDFLWLDPDKSVYVLQNKLHPKDNSFYVDLGYMMNMTSTFQETNGAQIKLGYFLNENWAIEFSHLKYSNADNSTLKSVESVAGLAPFIRRPLSSSTIFAVWSPFYGKINTFNQIYYFDWSFGVGTGAYKMESNLDTAELKTENRFEDESYTPIQLKTTFKFHINKSLNIGLELLNTNFEAGTPKNPKTKTWDQNNDLIFSIGASF
jgi:outer membrane beta-barrel protein